MTYLSLFGLGLADNLRGTLFPEILKTFSISNSQGSWFFIITSLFSIISGYYTHSLSRRSSAFSVWRLGVFLMALGTLAFFVASTFSFLLGGAAILGAGFGILAVTQNVLVTAVTGGGETKRSSQKALSGLHSMYGFSSFLSPLLVTQFAHHQIPWKYLFLLASLIIFLLCFSSFLKSPTIETNLINVTEAGSPAHSTSELSIFEIKQKWLFALTLSTYVALELMISTRMTTYLTVHQHLPLSEASNYLTYFFVFLLLGRLLFSFFHPPLSTKKTLLLSLLGSMMMLILGLRVSPIYLSLSGFFMAPFYPLGMALAAELFPRRVSSIFSFTISLQSIFVILMNLGVGVLTDQFGIAVAMNSAFVFGTFSWGCLMLHKPTTPPSITPLSLQN